MTHPSAAEVVTAMCAAWATRDADQIAAFFHEDAIYHNIPMDPLHGRDTIREFIAGFIARPTSVEFETVHQVADGNLVFNERIDRFISPSGSETALPVAGVFVVDEGLITQWRDYFDPRQAAGLAE